MKQLLSTITSVWYVLFEKKATVLLVLLLPALLTFLAGIAYDHNNTFVLTLGVHTESTTPLGMSVLNAFEDQGYTLIRYKTEDLCLERVKEGKIHSCVVLKKIVGREQATFYVNPSDVGVAEHLRDIVYSSGSGPTAEITKNNTRELLGEVQSAREAAANIRPTIVDLTTNYAAIAQEVDAFAIELSTTTNPINLSLLLDNESLGGNKGALLAWVDTLGRVKTDMLNEYDGVQDDVTDLLNDMAVSEVDKSKITSRLTDGRTRLDAISDQFRSNEILTRSRADKLTTAIQQLAGQLAAIEGDIRAFNELKSEAHYRAAKVKSHVDKTLLGVANVQKSLNIIGSAVLDVTGDDPAQILAPLDTRISTVRDESTPFDYVFPNILLLFVFIAGISLSGMTHIHFNESPAALRRRATPVHPRVHALGQHLGVYALVASAGLIMSVTALFFLPLSLSTLPLLGAAVLGTGLVSVLLGSFIAHFVHTEEQTMIAGMGVTFGLVLISPLLQPIEQLPSFLRIIAEINPLTLGLNITRSAVGAGGFNYEAVLLLAIASITLWTVLLGHEQWNTSN